MYDVIVVGARVAGAPTAMLCARAGLKVLLVDRDTFPSDTMSTHYIHQPGVAALKRWGLLDRLVASGCPPMTWIKFNFGPLQLDGFGPPADGVPEAYCPRRTVLDKLLVDAAREAGADVREGFSVLDILFDGDTVTGIRGRGADGVTVEERAKVVVGADGMRSIVARAVNAPTYNEKPSLACYYYSYWSGVPMEGAEFGFGDGCVFAAFPTHDGKTCVVAGTKGEQFLAYRADIDGTHRRIVGSIRPSLAERMDAGTRDDRWVGTGDLPNFFRKPYGPGWALVGDAGYHKDPVTGYGITDSLRDSETLAEALVAGLSGRAGLDEALAGYEQKRNEFALPMYDLITQMASLETPPPDLMAVMVALKGNQEAINQFYGVLDGTVSVPEFFAPENIGAIMAAAEQRGAAA
jgi:2-polyprenyl-6-methoxyphenol hydroxylase-like FAD-dependent oxidoreductase